MKTFFKFSKIMLTVIFMIVGGIFTVLFKLAAWNYSSLPKEDQEHDYKPGGHFVSNDYHESGHRKGIF